MPADHSATAANASLISTRSRSVGLEVGPLESDAQGFGRPLVQRRVRTGSLAVGEDLGEDRQSGRLGGRPVGDDDRRGTVGDLRGVARSDRAVATNAGTELAERLGGRAGADALVVLDHHRVAAPSAARRRARSHRRARRDRRRLPPLWRGSRPPIRPVRPGRCPSGRFLMSDDSPMMQWSNAHHSPSWVMESTSVASPMRETLAGLGQNVRGVRHRLHAAGDDELTPRRGGCGGPLRRSPSCRTSRPC